MKSWMDFGLVILSAILVADVRAQCEDGWSFFQRGNKCIKAFDLTGLSWKEAMYRCIREEAHLVTIPDKSTQDFVNQLVDQKTFYWIGLTDFKNEHEFLWVDGTSLASFSNWGDDQPDNHGGENCVHLREDLKWNDFSCDSSTNKFICEKRGPGCAFENGGCPNNCVDENTADWKVSCSNPCDPGFAEVNGACYDVDECSINNGGCDEFCENQNGTFVCTCLIDYVYDGTKCVVIDGPIIG